MVKLKRMLIPENGMNFDDVCSAQTESYIVIWNYISDCFVVLDKNAHHFECVELPSCQTFDELNEAVYKACGEYLEEVSDKSKYEFKLVE